MLPAFFVGNVAVLLLVASKDQRGIGAAKAEAVRHHRIEPCIIHPLPSDRGARKFGIKFINICRSRNKIVFEHEQAVD